MEKGISMNQRMKHNVRMIIQSWKQTISVLYLLAILTSCDVGVRFLFNDEPRYTLQGDSGTVTLSGYSLDRDDISFHFDGDFYVNLDSLKVLYFNQEVPNLHVKIYRNDVLISFFERRLHINGKEVLRVSMRDVVPYKLVKTGYIEILPSDFILCNGKPIITDTIRLSTAKRYKSLKRFSVD